MKKKERIAELERRVAELEMRLINQQVVYYPAPQPTITCGTAYTN